MAMTEFDYHLLFYGITRKISEDERKVFVLISFDKVFIFCLEVCFLGVLKYV